MGKMPNSWTDRDHILHTYGESSGNGHSLLKNNLSRPQGALERLVGHKLKNVGTMSNSWSDRDQLWHMYADSSGNGHELKKVTP